MQRVPVTPDLKLARTLDSLFRQSHPIYDNLEAFSLEAMMRSLAQAQGGKPLHEAVFEEVSDIIALEAPGMEASIREQMRGLDRLPMNNQTDVFIAAYVGFQFVYMWLNPTNGVRPSPTDTPGVARYMRMLAELSALSSQGVNVTINYSGPGLRP